jgi:hypothetical protein
LGRDGGGARLRRSSPQRRCQLDHLAPLLETFAHDLPIVPS